MRSILSALVIFLGLVCAIAVLVAFLRQEGLRALPSNHSGLVLVVALLISGSLLAARQIDRQGFYHSRFVKLLYRLLPFIKDIFPPDAGTNEPASPEGRRARQRSIKWLDRFLAFNLIVALGAAIYIGIALLFGYQFHRLGPLVEECEKAHHANLPGAREVCRNGLAKADAYLPAAERGKLKEPDAFWLGRTQLLLLSGDTRCEVRAEAIEGLAKLRNPENFDAYEKVVALLATLDQTFDANCRTVDVQQGLDALKEQLGEISED